MKRTLLSACFLFLPLYGTWLFGQGVWIHAKAQLAQVLLESAWSKTLQGQKEVKPWPWADTWPVGRLTVPRLGQHRIVLAGASGASLAFGPGHLFNTANPNVSGNCVIVGHRDTHFDFIQSLSNGDRIILQSADGKQLHYEIVSMLIVNEHSHEFITQHSDNSLTLITCYPFDAIRPGGPLRFVVIAKPVEPSFFI